MFLDIWDKFLKKCAISYNPGENLFAEEQLFPFKVRGKFIQHMTNKPFKFNIRFWVLLDIDSKFMFNDFT